MKQGKRPAGFAPTPETLRRQRLLGKPEGRGRPFSLTGLFGSRLAAAGVHGLLRERAVELAVLLDAAARLDGLLRQGAGQLRRLGFLPSRGGSENDQTAEEDCPKGLLHVSPFLLPNHAVDHVQELVVGLPS